MSDPQPSSRRVPRRTLIALLVVLLIAAPTAAYGLWQHSAQVSAQASAATLGAPTNLRCANVTDLSGFAARVNWTAPASRPAGTIDYRVVVTSGTHSDTITVQNRTDHTFRMGLLEGLVGGVWSLLFGGTPVNVSVQAIHRASGWTSVVSSETVSIRRSYNLTGGVRCA